MAAHSPGIDTESFRTLGYRAVDMAADYLANLPDQAVFTPMSEEERSRIRWAELPSTGIDPDVILDRFVSEILPFAMGNGHPRFFGWANTPPAPIGILADFFAATMNPSVAGGDHAAVYVERAVIRWMMELVGMPVEGSMGLLVSGGSMASLTCLTAARHRAANRAGWNVREEGLQGVRPEFTVYLSTEAHTTLHKAVELLGIGTRNLRLIPVDQDFRINLEVLRAAVEADVVAGKSPLCICASAGTVSTGAVDPLDALADLARKFNMWLHVDGAMCGIGILDSEKRSQFAGLERADSIAIDPHKWLQVPVECGCALVRDAENLRETFSLVPAYLRTEEGKGVGGLPWYSEYGFQQSRSFRALKLWMTLLHLGKDGLSEMVQRHNRLAAHLDELVSASPHLELLAPANLTVVCFRFVSAGLDGGALDALNKRIMQAVQAGGETFVTQATVDGRFALRANVMHYATDDDDIRALIDVVCRIGLELSV